MRFAGFRVVCLLGMAPVASYCQFSSVVGQLTSGQNAAAAVAQYTRGAANLSNWYAKLERLRQHVPNTQASIVVIGDSFTAQDVWTGPVRDALQSEFGNAGDGYVAFDTREDVPSTVAKASTGAWTETSNIPTSKGVNIADTTCSDASGDCSKTVTARVTNFVLQYIKQRGGGSFRYSVDGREFTDVSTAGDSLASAFLALKLGDAPADHTLRIELQRPGTTGVTLLGVDCQIETNGVRVHRIGNPGRLASEFAQVNPSIWEADLAALQPDVVMFLFGANEAGSGIAPSVVASNLATLIGRVRNAMPSAGVVLATPLDVGIATAYPIGAYVSAMRDVANSQATGFIDNYGYLGPFAAANLRGYYQPNMVHPSVAGGEMMGYLAAAFLTNDKGTRASGARRPGK